MVVYFPSELNPPPSATTPVTEIYLLIRKLEGAHFKQLSEIISNWQDAAHKGIENHTSARALT